MKKYDKDAIAVVGMSALFADARNYREFWNNILTNKTCIHEVDESRWSVSDFYDPKDITGDKTCSKVLGKIPPVDVDLLKLGIPPTSIEVIETSQLLGVQLAEEALIDASLLGENAKPFNREKTGVIVAYNGVGSLTENWWSRLQKPKWQEVLINSGLTESEAESVSQKILNTYLPWQEASFPGYLANVVSGRISNRLDLNGLNYIVGAACASTLAAIRAASHELYAGTCETLLVGAVCIDSMILSFLGFANAQALTKKEYCSPFDKDSDGMLLGEGIGFVVLKRLKDAVNAGDRIYGIIRGTGAASDGKGKSIYAPAEKGQILALKNAYESSEIDPATITMIEAHGTGTKVGDEVELTSLNHFFGKVESASGIALGSVKSQIGHTRTSAGMASLIKVMLGLYYKTLPLTANINEPNSAVSKPFYLNIINRPWFSFENQPRRAGINSFGFGGTNFHAIVEEHIDSENRVEWDVNYTPALFLFSSDSLADMLKKCEEILSAVQDINGILYYKDLCALSADSINQSVRLSICAQNFNHFKSCLFDIITQLEKGTSNIEEKYYFLNPKVNITLSKVAFVLPSVEKLHLNMGLDILLRFPELQSLFTEKEAALLYPSPVFSSEIMQKQHEELNLTENAQVCFKAIHKMYKLLLEKADISLEKILSSSTEYQCEDEKTIFIDVGLKYEDFLYALAKLWQYGISIKNEYFQPNSVHSTELQDKNRKFTIKINGGRYLSESTKKIEVASEKENLIIRGSKNE